jgi:Bax protein
MTSSLRSRSSFLLRDAFISLFSALLLFGLPLYISDIEISQSKKQFSSATLVNNIQMPLDEQVNKLFSAYSYNLDKIKAGRDKVPNLFLERLPRELSIIENTTLKKEIFIAALLPAILKVNEFILFERTKLLKILSSFEESGSLSANDRYWLEQKMDRYRLEEFDLDRLRKRMNIIPPSLALTQAAVESGWGTSRFAQNGNALFGQWTWEDSNGMIPFDREIGENHSIKTFSSLIEAVESYSLNLNTHEAYQDFRFERDKFANPNEINVNSLVETLINYSEQGYEYIDYLNNVIETNQLQKFDAVELQENSFHDTTIIPDR